MQEVTVADIMTREPIMISPKTNLLECARKMVKKKVGSLLIVDGKKLVGFISRQDILWALIKKSKEDLNSIQAGDISPKKIATTKPTATIRQVLSKMKKLKFDRLPVIQDKKLVGIITVRDILNFNPEFYPELEEFAKIREETQKLKRLREIKAKKVVQEGICSQCGNYGSLYDVDGVLLCESCANSI